MKKRKIFKKKWWDNYSRKMLLKRKKYNKKAKRVYIYDGETTHTRENLIERFIKSGFIEKQPCGNTVELEPPKEFIFYGNIDDTISFLRRTVYLVQKRTLKRIYINHSTIEKISLSASLILDLILMNAEEYVKTSRNRRALQISGEVKKDTDVGILIHANGVLPHLGFEVEKDKNVRTLELINGDNNRASCLDPASDIIKYFSECLRMQKLSLTKIGKGELGKILGEVIDNCKLHSGKNGRWYALGFFHNKGNVGICHIAIVTVGNTIYESLSKKGNVTIETYDALKDETKKHRKNFSDKWNEELLWTWLSLQQAVSRMRDSTVPENSNRGTGTVDMMASFEKIGGEMHGYKPIFSLISGNTMIEFDFKKYPVQEEYINGEKRKIMTFNHEKNLNTLPDFNNVKLTKNFYPGVIYNMEFCINGDYIENGHRLVERSSTHE